MTVKEAKKYILDTFKHQSEIRSYMQDVTEDGVFNKEDVAKFDNETLVAIAEDMQYQFKCEFGHLIG